MTSEAARRKTHFSKDDLAACENCARLEAALAEAVRAERVLAVQQAKEIVRLRMALALFDPGFNSLDRAALREEPR